MAWQRENNAGDGWLRSIFALAGALAFGSLTGCAAFQQTSKEVTIREPGARTLGQPQPVQPEAMRDLEFAWLSDAAYQKTAAGQKALADDKAAIAQAQAQASPPAAPVPGSSGCPDSEQALRAAGWQRWDGFPDDGLLEKIKKSHLRIEVWTRNDPPAVAVAFGGTVFNNGNDWLSNLRWFPPSWFVAGHPDEYSETVQEFGPAFVAEFKRRAGSADEQWAFLKHATLYSTGHSLGGGLAQQFAYALPLDDSMPRVAKVYAFDPSPVTGFYSVDAAVRDVNRQGLQIDRIYERGEILALVRSFTSFFVAPSAEAPAIRGVRYSLFPTANPISGHSMSTLACKLYSASRQP